MVTTHKIHTLFTGWISAAHCSEMLKEPHVSMLPSPFGNEILGWRYEKTVFAFSQKVYKIPRMQFELCKAVGIRVLQMNAILSAVAFSIV